MLLRKLKIEIDLPNTATGYRAKQEHIRLLKSVLALIEDPAWAGFSLQLHDSYGVHVGSALLHDGKIITRKEIPLGDSEPAGPRACGIRS